MRFHLLTLSALTALLAAPLVDATSSYFVPLPEDSLLNEIFEVISSVAESPVYSSISVACSTDETIVYWDHEEDGMDPNAQENNRQSTTLVYGDGNKNNGCAPKVGLSGPCRDEDDYLDAGDVLILENAVPNNSGKYPFSGGDHMTSNFPIAMTRSAFPGGAGSMMAGAVEVIDQSNWGDSYTAPIGQNNNVDTQAYQFVAMAVMAGEDNTVIRVNGQNRGTLKAGEAKVITVNQGAKLTATKNVQVHLITGDKGSTYELRWYSLSPDDQWGSEYYAPVGDTEGDVRVTLYNPGNSKIYVKCKRYNKPTITIGIPSKRHRVSPTINNGGGAKFYEAAGKKFFAFSSTDTTKATTKGQIYDWGYPLMTIDQLTSEALVGLGHGCTYNDCDSKGERSVVWVMPVEAAYIWVDFNNDGTIDQQFQLNALQHKVVTDSEDEDMSGAIIWATEGNDSSGQGVKLSAAWGQKAANSKSGDSRALDMGTVIVPFEPISHSCSVVLVTDNDGDGEISPGDIVEQTIVITNSGQTPIGTGTIAVETLDGETHIIDPLEARGDSNEFKVEYPVPPNVDISASCEIEIVPAPPTGAPTDAPTDVPTKAPTDGPTKAPTDTPTKAPTDPPAPDQPTPDDRGGPPTYVKGDPHFKTFGGEMYDFHGECDLVLVHNPTFAGGLGMDIHIRTKIEDFWSSVESAAMKIGESTLEIRANEGSDEWLWVNGELLSHGIVVGKWYTAEMDGFLVRYKETSSSVREALLYMKEGSSKEHMVFKTFKSFVRVDVDWTNPKNFQGATGLLGSFDQDGLRVARDGQTFIKNTHTFGQEWQVSAEEPQLFHSYEGAVVGQKCIMPPAYTLEKAASMKRRLRASNMTEQDAQQACDHLVDPEEKQACVFDVLATQDLSMASAW